MPTPSSSRLPADLFDRYLAGQCSAEESARVAAALRDNPGLRAFVDETRAPAISLDARWDRFAQTHLTTAPAHDPASRAVDDLLRPSRPPVTHLSRRRWIGATLAAGCAAAVLFAVVRAPGSSDGETRVTDTRTYATRAGQRMTAELPDGSHVTLAPQTTLQYARDARGGSIVQLDGHAYFEVTHRADRSFVVRTGAVDTRVLGTAFDVQQYASDRDARIAVVTGKVAVQSHDRRAILTPGMIARAGASAGDSTVVVDAGRDVRALTAWTSGDLSFTGTPIPEMLVAVGRWYGYEFQIADSALLTQDVTVSLSADRPQEAMRMLKEILNVTMTFGGKDGRVVTLRRQSVSRRPGTPGEATRTLTPQTLMPGAPVLSMSTSSAVETGK